MTEQQQIPAGLDPVERAQDGREIAGQVAVVFEDAGERKPFARNAPPHLHVTAQAADLAPPERAAKVRLHDVASRTLRGRQRIAFARGDDDAREVERRELRLGSTAPLDGLRKVDDEDRRHVASGRSASLRYTVPCASAASRFSATWSA